MTDATKIEPVDISSEQWRKYHYGDGKPYRIEAPHQLFIFEGKSGWTHRVVDSAGVTHRPTPGWLAISWLPKDGSPPFVA